MLTSALTQKTKIYIWIFKFCTCFLCLPSESFKNSGQKSRCPRNYSKILQIPIGRFNSVRVFCVSHQNSSRSPAEKKQMTTELFFKLPSEFLNSVRVFCVSHQNSSRIPAEKKQMTAELF